MKYKVNVVNKLCAIVEEGPLELCTVLGSDSNEVAKKIANAMHLYDTIQKGTEAEIKNLITEIKKK
jgi:hypothetical protein